jgi:chromosome segregation ATPase
MDLIPLTRKEKEKKVIEMYKQGKRTREITKICRINFFDLGKIIRKHFGGGESKDRRPTKLSKQSQALKLFQDGKKNIEISIELGITADETIDLQKQYRKLINDDNFCEVYEVIKDDIFSFLELYELMKEEELTADDAVNAVRDKRALPLISYDYSMLNKQVSPLRQEVDELTQEREELEEKTDALREEREELEEKTDALREERDELTLEILAMAEQKARRNLPARHRRRSSYQRYQKQA